MSNTAPPTPEQLAAFKAERLRGRQDYVQRTEDACAQLQRYGGGVYDTDLLDALDAIEDVNDALWNAHAVHFIYRGIDEAIAALNKLREKTVAQAAGKAGA